MRIVLVILFSVFVVGVFAQPFQPDAYGRVSGDTFKNFCNNRGYSLVGSFERLTGNKEGKVAMVIKGGTWLYIDLNGKEFPNYTTLAKEYGLPRPEDYYFDEMPGDYTELKQYYPAGYKPKYTGRFQKGDKWGYKYNDKVIVQPIYDEVDEFSSGDFQYYRVKNNDLYGLCDFKGTLITPIAYSRIEFLPRGSSSCFFIAEQNKKWGVLSRGGKVTSAPEFDILRPENVGKDFVIFAMKNGKLGAITSLGKHVVAEEYDDLYLAACEDTLYGFIAQKGGKSGFLNMQGKMLIDLQYEKLGYDQKNFLTYRTSTGVGAMDSTGKQLFPPIYFHLSKPPKANCIIVTTQEPKLIGIADLEGNWIEEPRYTRVTTLNYEHKGVYIFETQKEKFHQGLYNTTTLKWVLPCEHKITPSGNYAVVEKEQLPDSPLAGIIGNDGKILISVKYQKFRYVPEQSFATASNGQKFGLVGHGDKIILPFQYDGLEALASYHQSKAAELFVFTANQKKGVIDFNGKIIVPAKYDEIQYAHSGVICKDSNTYELLSFEGKKFISANHKFHYSNEGFFFWKDSTGFKAFDTYGRMGRYSPKPGYMGYQEFDMEPPIEVLEPVETKENRIYEVVEEEAQFPGGVIAFKQFVRDNLKYPVTALELEIGGKCYLKFVVELDGSLTDIKVLRGVNDCMECDQEAIRLVKQMPKFTPGKIGGEFVRSSYNLPIPFNPY